MPVKQGQALLRQTGNSDLRPIDLTNSLTIAKIPTSYISDSLNRIESLNNPPNDDVIFRLGEQSKQVDDEPETNK